MNRISIKVIVEVERGSSKRAVFDEHLTVLDYRQANTSYPFAYGFILNTTSEDGDGIDCYVLTDQHLEVGAIIDCLPIGLLEVFENEEVDCKIVCIIENDDFKFDQKHIERIKNFILQIFKKHPEIDIQFGEYKDGDCAADYVNERLAV